jgi:3-hydroxyisobutyrate dehydrogenase-like beta-hydroxyacid dehydrogenase
MADRIGFIGFGEVGRTFAQELCARGAAVFYSDVVDKGDTGPVALRPLPELLRECDVILSTVGTHIAVKVAGTAAPLLTAGKTYADLNSTSGPVKQRIAAVIEPSGADFVEGAILSAVGEAGPRAAILVGGRTAPEFAARMNRLGLVNVRYFSPTIGEASQVKMLRSIFSKGVECLLLEMLVAGRRAGVAEHLWKDIVEFMTTHPFQSVAENWIKTHPGACQRRYHEMLQVLETLKELDIEPTMTRGTAAYLERSTRAGLAAQFPRKPERFWEVSDWLERQRQHEVEKGGDS